MRKVFCKKGICSLDRPPQLGLGNMGRNGTSGILVEGPDYLIPLSNVQKAIVRRTRSINQRGKGKSTRSSNSDFDQPTPAPIKKSRKRTPRNPPKPKATTKSKKAAKPKKATKPKPQKRKCQSKK